MEFAGIEKLSLLDYDKHISCTLFTVGCPFRCPFCHNGDLVLNPSQANSIPFEDILSYLSKRKGVLDGVAITGGEPTLMADLPEKIRKIKDLGFSVKLDTNGSNPKMVKRLIDEKLIDYVAMDIKNSKEKYAKTIGLPEYDLTNVEETMRILKSSGIEFEFRTTLIEEFHTEEDFKKIAEWIKGAKHYRIQKYRDREGCLEHGFHEVKKEIAERYLKYFEGKVEDAVLRGYDN